jgi:TRAP-type C4-dicarboxylate transport system permease small subunit
VLEISTHFSIEKKLDTKGIGYMRKIKQAAHLLANLVELYIPGVVFILLFIVFLINIITRYVLKNPQNWTLEFSLNAFVVVGLLGACTAYRKNDHVVFDLFYNSFNRRTQNILRIVSYLLIIIFFSIAIPPALKYLLNMRAKSSILKIPHRILFLSFPIMLAAIVIRSIIRLTSDIRALVNKTYVQTYDAEEKDELI